MVTEKIEFTNYNGEKDTETLYFNLSPVELTELELSESEGLSNKIQKLIKEKNNREIYKTFKNIVLLAYGVKSPDGKQFIKSEKLSQDFVQTAAYEEFMWSLMSDETKAANFINELTAKANKLTALQDSKKNLQLDNK